MSDQAPSSIELLQRRLALVGEIAALNACALKLVQSLAGAGMEVQRIELEIAKAGAPAQLVRDLHEAEMNAEAIRLKQGECDSRITKAEQQVAALDRALATARRT